MVLCLEGLEIIERGFLSTYAGSRVVVAHDCRFGVLDKGTRRAVSPIGGQSQPVDRSDARVALLNLRRGTPCEAHWPSSLVFHVDQPLGGGGSKPLVFKRDIASGPVRN